jgi:hypothetical protein
MGSAGVPTNEPAGRWIDNGRARVDYQTSFQRQTVERIGEYIHDQRRRPRRIVRDRRVVMSRTGGDEVADDDNNNNSINNDGFGIVSLMVGGEKGHIVESIEGNVRRLYEFGQWKPIPHCTGRYTFRHNNALVQTIAPAQLLNFFVQQPAHCVESSSPSSLCCFPSYKFILPNKDPIIVVPLDDTNTTGIISYVKQRKRQKEQQEDGSGDECYYYYYYIHTLNTPSGFRRKLQAMGIYVDDHRIWYRSDDR